MHKVELDMLLAALVSWVVTHVMDELLSILDEIRKTIWENTMKLVTLVIRLVAMLVVNTICSSVIVVGVCLEWLAHVARAVGISVFLAPQAHIPTGLLPLRPATPPFIKFLMKDSVPVVLSRFGRLFQ